MTTERHLVVVGLMASGKSAVAAELAARLGRPLRDSDSDLEEATGLSVRELAARDGVEAMHDREAQHLLDALAAPTPAVIAPAASTIERHDCRTALAAVITVWLDVPPEVLAGRFASRPHRPDFGVAPEDLLREQHARRAPLFTEVATLVVRDDTASPDELAERILRTLG